VALQGSLGEVLVGVGEVEPEHLGERTFAAQDTLDLRAGESGAEVDRKAPYRRVALGGEALRLEVMDLSSPLLE
jgi:hypothetical protein